MYSSVDTKDPTAVELEVQAACRTMVPEADPGIVPRAFAWAVGCFNGNYQDYQAVDTRYHDLEHTLQGTLCLARLLQGRSHPVPRLWIDRSSPARVDPFQRRSHS